LKSGQISLEQFEKLVSQHLENLSPSVLEGLRRNYAEDHMAIIGDLLPGNLREAMESEGRTLLLEEAIRREVVIRESGNTPRSYNSVGRNRIRERGSYIPAFFDSPSILEFLSQIVGEPLHRVPYEPEEFIINSQCNVGDTHGWHWDDYTFALVWIIDEPDVLHGGRVEFIPRIPWKKSDTRAWIENVLASYPIKSYHVPSGKCYLLRARDALHRISPLTGRTQRTVVVFTYATESDLSDSSLTHGSMEVIYPIDTNTNQEETHE
jgi:hypothetical protein